MINILISDDNIYYAKTLMNTINGYSNSNIKVTHIAIDGKETLDILRDNSIDILLLDLKMPIYDGIHILNKIKEEKFNKYEQSVIIISGEIEMLYRFKDDLYVYRAINKMCSISEIIDIINQLIKDKEEKNREIQIKNKIIRQLQYLNYNLSHKGSKYLIEVINLIYNSNNYDTFNLKEQIYPIVAKQNKKSIHNIKCDINKANDYMYKVCKKERIRRYFKFFDDTKPTVKNVIYTILNKVVKDLDIKEENVI